MSIEEKITLTRSVLHCAPDGTSVTRAECVEAWIYWPDSMAKDEPGNPYIICGQWSVTKPLSK